MTTYRHSDNSNLILINDEYYQNYKINCGVDKPIISNYLDSLINLLKYAHERYSRLFAIRFDLRFPNDWSPEKCTETQVISNFTQALKGRIRNARKGKSHGSDLMFAWAKEVGSEAGKPHYHFVILLNGNAYFRFVKLNPLAGNMFGRICQSWASALGISTLDAGKLVHIPENAYYDIKKNDDLNDLIYRCSYLCKQKDKQYGQRDRSFQTSSVPVHWQRSSDIES